MIQDTIIFIYSGEDTNKGRIVYILSQNDGSKYNCDREARIGSMMLHIKRIIVLPILRPSVKDPAISRKHYIVKPLAVTNERAINFIVIRVFDEKASTKV